MWEFGHFSLEAKSILLLLNGVKGAGLVGVGGGWKRVDELCRLLCDPSFWLKDTEEQIWAGGFISQAQLATQCSTQIYKGSKPRVEETFSPPPPNTF